MNAAAGAAMPEAIADLLREIDFNDPVISKKANTLWKLLDRLAEKNPVEYRKFIAEQLRQGPQELSQFVHPWFCLQTEPREDRIEELTDEDNGGSEAKRRRPRYINFCTSAGVKAPDGETVPIVMSGERQHYENDDDQVGYYVYDAIFAPQVKARAENDNMYLDDIMKLALDCVEESFKTKLRKRGYKVFWEGTSSNYKGPFTWTRAGKEISHPPRPPQVPDTMTPRSLLENVKKTEDESEGEGAKPTLREIRTKTDVSVKIPGIGGGAALGQRKPLIQELGESVP